MSHEPGGADDPGLPLVAAVKLAGFAETGGMAGRRIRAGEVRVNGEVETRKKRRLRPGDEITVDGETFVIDLAEDEDEDEDDGEDGVGGHGAADDPDLPGP